MGKKVKKLKDIRREYVKKYFTGNLGKVVEEEDQLICYVDKKKCKKEKNNYTLKCKGISSADKQIAEMYGLNKPIVYILKNFYMKTDNFYLSGYNDCTIIIKDSIIRDLKLSTNGDCYLNNVQTKAVFPQVISAMNLYVTNSNLSTYLSQPGFESLVDLNATGIINVDNSTIGKKDEIAEVNLKSNSYIKINNSKILGNEILLDAPEIDKSEDSYIWANEKVTIKSDDLEDYNISSPTVAYYYGLDKNQKVYRKVNTKWSK